jgi:hypothetical protein
MPGDLCFAEFLGKSFKRLWRGNCNGIKARDFHGHGDANANTPALILNARCGVIASAISLESEEFSCASRRRNISFRGGDRERDLSDRRQHSPEQRPFHFESACVVDGENESKTVLPIAFGLRFAHGLGLPHEGGKQAISSSMLISGFKSRVSVRSAWKPAKWNHFLAKGGGRRRTLPRLRPFFSRSRLVALPLGPSVQLAARLSLPLFQRFFRG